MNLSFSPSLSFFLKIQIPFFVMVVIFAMFRRELSCSRIEVSFFPVGLAFRRLISSLPLKIWYHPISSCILLWSTAFSVNFQTPWALFQSPIQSSPWVCSFCWSNWKIWNFLCTCVCNISSFAFMFHTKLFKNLDSKFERKCDACKSDLGTFPLWLASLMLHVTSLTVGSPCFSR